MKAQSKSAVSSSQATLGVSGPKKRPREAAVNFGLEIAIVVVSVLFSGRAAIADGELKLGHNCLDPLGSDVDMRATSGGTAHNALPLFVDVLDSASAQEYYGDWCNDYTLRTEDKCVSPLGWFPPPEADGNDATWSFGQRCSTAGGGLGPWNENSGLWVGVLQRWHDVCRYDDDEDSAEDCIAASLEVYGPSWRKGDPSMDVNVMRRAACGYWCKDHALEQGLLPGESACCQFQGVDSRPWEPGSDDPEAECRLFAADDTAGASQLFEDQAGDDAAMLFTVTAETHERSWACEWGPRKVTIMETKLLALAIGGCRQKTELRFVSLARSSDYENRSFTTLDRQACDKHSRMEAQKRRARVVFCAQGIS
jgi:hypothetical protein